MNWSFCIKSVLNMLLQLYLLYYTLCLVFFLEQLTNQSICLFWSSSEEGRDNICSAHAEGWVPVRSEGWDEGDGVEEYNIKEKGKSKGGAGKVLCRSHMGRMLSLDTDCPNPELLNY